MEVRKATRQDLKRHNRLSVLRAVYYGLADNRAALAVVTGLTKPTISELVAQLIADGYLAEVGTGESTEVGGKPPRLLSFVPDARQVIGVSVDGINVRAVLLNLAGQTGAAHITPLDGATGETALSLMIESINALVAQLDAPLLALGIGIPGGVDGESGMVIHSAVMGWHGLPLAQQLSERYGCPCVIANNTELAALAQVTGGPDDSTREADNRVTLLVHHTVEIGVTVRGATYHHGRDVGALRSSADSLPWSQLLGWTAVQARAAALCQTHPPSMLPAPEDLSYLHIRYAAALGDTAALALLDELADTLTTAVVWSLALLHPQTVVIAGPIADLGNLLTDRLRENTAERLSADDAAVRFTLANDTKLSARGAAVLAAHHELDILL
jgi:predicted NBD/HSP70 family sugar kinase